MRLEYDGSEVELGPDAVEGLQQYARSVLRAMQEEDATHADCWTRCEISFEELQPEFTFGAVADAPLTGSSLLTVELLLEED